MREAVWIGQLHTLAQFARRAGISEGRARALYHVKPTGLPRPDRFDVDGRPLWSSSTIDSWCASTGREVHEDALWLHRTGPATSAPVELRRGLVEVALEYGAPMQAYVIVWDTAHGHVIYLRPLDAGGLHPDWIAHTAGQLIEPRFWATATVIMPFLEPLDFAQSRQGVDDAGGREPIAYIYRLSATKPEGRGGPSVGGGGGHGRFAGLRRWLTAGGEDAGEDRPTRAYAEWITHLTLDEIARALGARLPVWIEGTLTEEAIARSLAYDRTFTVADHTTAWPEIQRRLETAVAGDLPETHPAAWAALAVDGWERLREIRDIHANLPNSGPGWYLVVRPALPAVPMPLERRLAAAALAEDTDQLLAELADLRRREADLDVDDPLGPVYQEVAQLLALQLLHAAKRPDGTHDPAVVAALDEQGATYEASWDGPVVEQWATTLTEVEDPAAALRLRRVHRLIGHRAQLVPDAIYRDPAGRYVLVWPARENTDEPADFTAEWPTSLAVVESWTTDTILAADPGHTPTTLMALTPTADGDMRVDPVPMQRSDSGSGFGYGYTGGTPVTTCLAVMRCAVGAEAFETFTQRGGPSTAWQEPDEEDGQPSRLWQAISTTQGPLRLAWPSVQQWARQDLERVRTRPSARRSDASRGG